MAMNKFTDAGNPPTPPQGDSDASEASNEFVADRTNREGMYAIVYFGLTDMFGFSPTEALLVAEIYSLSRQTGWCYAGQKSLAKSLNVSDVTVNQLLELLRTRDILEKGGRHKKLSTIQWRLAPVALGKLDAIQRRIERERQEKRNRAKPKNLQ